MSVPSRGVPRHGGLRRAAARLATVALVGTLAPIPAPAAAPVATVATQRNVYQAGASVRPAGPVDGDFIGFGGRVVVDQAVKGDALLAGGAVEVRAPIGDDLRAAGGDVRLDASVGGEFDAAGGNVVLAASAQVAQGAAIAGGQVTIEGRITGPLKVSAQRVVVNGEVTGDVRLLAERVELGPKARIGGALSHASRVFLRADGAVVAGTVSRDESGEQGEAAPPRAPAQDRMWHGRYSGPSWVGGAFGYLGLLAAAAVFVLVFPKFTRDAPDTIRTSPWMSLAVGLGVLAGVPLLAVVLILTLLGIPLGLAALSLYPLMLLLGYLTGVLFVAQRGRAALRRDGTASFKSTMAFTALALLLLMLVAWLPMVGALVIFVTTIAGLGACVLTWQRRRPATASPA